MIDKLLDNPFHFLIVAFGISIIIFSLSKLAPHPLKFLAEMLRILVSEIDPKRKHDPAEKINLFIIILYFILSAVAITFELAPSGMRQAVGSGISPSFPYLSVTCVGILVIASILSPLFLMRHRKEQKTSADTKRSLKILKQLMEDLSEDDNSPSI